ncbi:MAG: hypothetical protein GY720_16985 [bacterium]|nr:hypothetical protein [bacterium]
MNLRRALSAGMIDSGFASLATFALNLYAIGRWGGSNPDLLGMYFLFATAFFMASAIPYQLLFLPAERESLSLPAASRLSLMNRVLVLGLPTSVLSASLVGLAAIVGLVKDFTLAELTPFLITAAVAAVFSPMQNYSRRLLHLAGKSWSAAAVSVVQFATALAALFGLLALGVAPRWLPLGALALANIVSLTVGLAISRSAVQRMSPADSEVAATVQETLTFGSLSLSGRWLVTTSLLSTGTNFAVESIITLLAGPVALGFAGSAKTVAQPVLVLASGLRSVLGPKSMEAAAARDRTAARHHARTFYNLTAAAVIGYSAFAGFAWALNPLSALVDNAYTIPGLVVMSIFAAGLNAAAFPGRTELIGANRETVLLQTEMVANSLQLTVATVFAALAGAATNFGIFARPVAFAILGGSRLVVYKRALDRLYSSRSEKSRTETKPA